MMARRAAYSGLLALTLLNLLNYIDRQILPAVLESVKRGLHLQDWQTGLLGTGFVAMMIVASPIFGILGDTHRRTRLIAVGAALWSLATAAGGLARHFAVLLTARIAVGVGEAGYGTIAPSLLSDYFPRKIRGRIFAIFYSAIPIGGALGFVVGGLINKFLGWRAAFFIAGLPGLLLAWWALRLAEPRRGEQDEGDPDAVVSEHGPVSWASYQTLFRNRLYVIAVAGYTAGTFAIGGLSFWMPAFLHRTRGMTEAEAAIQFGLIVSAAGFVGSLGGGWIADWLLQHTREAYLWMCGVSTLIAVPVLVVALVSQERPVYLAAIFVAALLLFASTGPINALLVNIVPAEMRASAIAASTMAIHLFGDAPADWVIGYLSYRTALDQAILIVPFFVALSGVIWTATAWRRESRRGSR